MSRKGQRATPPDRSPTRSSQESSRSKGAFILLVSSGIIEFKDVFVPDKNKLAKADSFENGLNKCLMESRLTITYMFLGGMAGAYEAAYKYEDILELNYATRHK